MRDIEAGHYDLACVLGLEYMRNVDGQTGADYLGAATWKGLEATDCNYPWPYMFDQILNEYDQRHGIDIEHVRSIAKINFANAKNNPNAQTRKWQFTPESFGDDDQAKTMLRSIILNSMIFPALKAGGIVQRQSS